MKKQFTALLMACIILVGVTVQAVDARSVSGPLNLTFNGTTATCTFTALEVGADITVMMTLLQGSKEIGSWTETGHSVVRMNEQCAVVKGETYTLKVSFTINGKAMPEQSVTKSN